MVTCYSNDERLCREDLVGHFIGDSDRTPRLIFRSLALHFPQTVKLVTAKLA